MHSVCFSVSRGTSKQDSRQPARKRGQGMGTRVYFGSRDSGFRTLSEGQKVEFEVKQGTKGLQAENVRVVG
jgi:hypothetical protein